MMLNSQKNPDVSVGSVTLLVKGEPGGEGRGKGWPGRGEQGKRAWRGAEREQPQGVRKAGRDF